MAGLDPNQVAGDLAAHVDGRRRVTGNEIAAAVNKAFAASSTVSIRHATPHSVVDSSKLLDAILDRGADFNEADLWEVSPIRIDWPPEDDAIEVLRRLYAPEDHLFMGARHDAGAQHVPPVSEWIRRIDHGIAIPEHIIPNPLTGGQSQTKDGKSSFRADSCVARFRFAVVEFDAMPREQQIQFWAGAPLPVVALIDSGGKSVHGWIRIDAATNDEWMRRVEGKLFSLLTAVGADGACKNEARLSRLPGHFRSEENRWQRVLYLNPSGGPVIP
jgi:hypothetical protein